MIKFLFAIFSYVLGLSSLMAFFWYVQFGVDHAPMEFSWMAIFNNTILFFIFPVQHSALARERVKKWIQKHFDPLLERCLYVGTSGLAMWIVLYLWQPIGPYLYRTEFSYLFDAIFYLALVLIIISTITLDHSRMFGLKQGYYAWKRIPFSEEGLKTTGIYGVIRHPLTSFFIVTLWAHESMTAGRLQLNLLFTAYAFIGTLFEERSLVKSLGENYLKYRERVPAFVPRILNHR